MNVKKHFFMTISALFFLGVIVAKPGDNFYPKKKEPECKLVKAKMHCEERDQEYRLNYSVIHYEYQ